ncbi:LysR family transcriptional regulator [Aliterella atlantica]|uniref:LysR family transcriptional regulator n=1 Tax=Aliterella atlantica CENA595 TaxID=1618023 RepID=A0A0D8ZYG2_9CYAN|nr:LysR family transcriptional regulator [Aliterella atlantica]KJH73447.1 LysR family transcriptional regulator [Aliterella atlantica CENA595]
MKHATLHQLKVFEAIARSGSFTRAAEELFLTQPTVSQQIKQLTKAVGLPLFDQVGKRLYLTDAGQEVLTVCQDISERLSKLEMKLADFRGLKQGNLRLAVITTAKYFVPRVLGPFRHRYPGINISLQVINRQQVLERLNENLDDLYILGQPPDNLDINLRPVLENPLVAIAPHNHPLAKEKNISLQRLAQEPFIMREPGSGTRMVVEGFFKENRVELNVEMEIGSNEAIKQAIAGGLGLSILSRHSLALEGTNGPLTVLDVEGLPIQRHWYIIYPASKQLSVVARTFLDYFLEEGKQIAEQTTLEYMQGTLVKSF